jgi:hypothetical protein
MSAVPREENMSKVLEIAQPITEWLQTEDGLRYKSVLLSKEEMTALRKRLQHRREST